MRLAKTAFALLLAFGLARADEAADIARIHTEAVGGRERIAALGSLRAAGYVIAGGTRVRFSLTAARPNRIRLETDNAGRTLVQGSDGVEPPWEFDTGTWPPRYRSMAESAARTFVGDAEFDDPLIAGESRGFALNYAGTMEVEGRKLLRVLVTHKVIGASQLLLDSESYLIAFRIEIRTSPGGRKIQIVTRYDDFRPVEGVLLPHQVVVAIDGRVTQETKIESIDANPGLSAESFSRPKAVSVPSVPGKP